MLRLLLRTLLYVAIFLTFAVLILGIIGGGWGEKPPLPRSWQPASHPLILSHRGVTLTQPENSIAAFDEALDRGFDGIEIDVQLTRDSNFIAFHDEKTDRLLGSDTVAALLSVSILKSSPLLNDDSLTGEFVPLISEIAQRYADRALFYFDLKGYGHDSKFELADDIASLVTKYGIEGRVAVASTSVLLICYLEYNHPQIITVMEGINPSAPWLHSCIPVKFRSDLIASRYATISDDFAAWLREENMNDRYITYHMEPAEIDNALRRGIKMYILDYAKELNEFLEPSIR